MALLLSLPWDFWHSPLIGLGLLMADGGVNAETFRYVVGIFVAAFGAALGVIRQMYESRLKEKDATIAEQKTRLDAYIAAAMDVDEQVRRITTEPPAQKSSHHSTQLPYPYERSRTTRRRPR